MLYRKVFAFVLISCSLSSGSAFAQRFDDLQGFKLGSTFAEAQQNANANGWQLRQLSPALPREWIVEGTNLGLFVCGEEIAAIRKELAGGLDEFATIVSDLRIIYGAPSTTVATFSVGPARISNIDARFESKPGAQIEVQLSSAGGKVGVHVNFASNRGCPANPEP